MSSETSLAGALGALAGLAATRLAAAPLERIQILQQQQPRLVATGKLRSAFGSTAHCAVHTIQAEGSVLALWRGLPTTVARAIANNLLSSLVKADMRALAQTLLGHPGGPSGMTPLVATLTNLLTGALALAVTYPLTTAHILIASDTRRADDPDDSFAFPSFGIPTLRSLVRQDSVLGVYRGLGSALLGLAVFRLANDGIVRGVRLLLPAETRQAALPMFALGFSATMAAGLVAYPLTTIRVQRAHPDNGFHSDWDCARSIYNTQGGLGAFYAGASAFAVRGVLVAASFVILETARR